MPNRRTALHLNRRQWLRHASAGVAASMGFATTSSAFAVNGKPRVAAIMTEYQGYSHADVIVGRFVKGYTLGVRPFWPRCQVVSMYVDQFPKGDLSRGIAAKFGIRIEPTIEKALSGDGKHLDVDGVLIVGEHGDYPSNAKGQHMYPRRRFFESTVRAFEKTGQTVPVFNDKHLGYAWEDAKWMYDQAREMNFPLMAGSSLPTTWRRPELKLPLGTELTEALAVGYGGIEAYGFHALETLQCMIERRRGGESGVRSVTCLEGDDVWQAAQQGRWSRKLLDAALACCKHQPKGLPEERCKQPAAFLIEHRDGFRSTVLNLNGFASAFLFAAQEKSEAAPVATHFWLQEPNFGHFSYLVHNIESMFLTGEEPYPPERTLLTTGILDAAMTSRFENHTRQKTPQLASIAYRSPASPGRRAMPTDGVLAD